jgi:NAD(P) transhydrogenase
LRKQVPAAIVPGGMREYDLVVIGSGPAGQKAAVQAAKLRRRVAVVECRDRVGGVCMNTGTIPSKTLREAALYLTGMSQRSLYGQSYRVKENITIDDLLWRTQHVIDSETDVVRDQLRRNRIDLVLGEGSFLDPHTIRVERAAGEEQELVADKVVIATGTRPARPGSVEFDERTIIDSDGILQLDHIPASLLVVGAGVVGIEYAAIFASLGSKVTVVEARDRLLDFCDGEIVEALRYHLRELGVTFRLRETVTAVELYDSETVTHLESGKQILSDVVLYSAGRQGATEALALSNAGLEADDRGRIAVDDRFRTAVGHIYAVGDVIGFPSLAATSMEQGRLAACDAFGVETDSTREVLPIGIYTVPEISYVGRTEEELTEASIPYEVGISRYHELARGQILGETHGLLKLLVDAESRLLLGVHAFGTGATELVHIGQAVMALGGTVDYLVGAVFNYPTLAESYKVAALDATNKLRALTRTIGSKAAEQAG